MGEVKSTLELAMERARSIEVSPGEMEKLQREQYVSKAKGMANRYINGVLKLSGLVKEVNSYDGNARNTIVEILMFELVNAIGISVDNKGLIEAIEALRDDRVKPILGKIFKLCDDFRDKKESQYKKVETEITDKLRGIGISGAAVQPKVDSHERWRHTLDTLTSDYEAKLLKLKGTLLD
ncbi:MAG: hypothetical protein ABID54_13135 [Pseudomonadota bacterium]